MELRMSKLSADDVSFVIACSHQKSYDLLCQKNHLEADVCFITSPNTLSSDTSIVILDQSALKQFSLLHWQAVCSEAIFIVEHPIDNENCILVPAGIPQVILRNAIITALSQLTTRQQLALSHQNLQHEHEQFSRLLDIGKALSAERDHNVLLARILKEARLLACCDAASIFLIDRHTANETNQTPDLVFKLTQNDSIDFHFEEQRFNLDNRSVAGYAALTGDIVNLDDVYDLPTASIYKFNASFDQSMHYRTRSMLVIPMSHWIVLRLRYKKQ
jgi:hypothetical protein